MGAGDPAHSDHQVGLDEAVPTASKPPLVPEPCTFSRTEQGCHLKPGMSAPAGRLVPDVVPGHDGGVGLQDISRLE